MPPSFRSLLLLAVVVAVGVAGCNVLDGAYDEGGSLNDLLTDARFARDRQDFESALDLLDEALDLEPSNPVVRLEYAATLMQRDGLDVAAVLDLADHLEREFENTGGRSGSAGGDSCTFADDVPAEPFDPSAAEGYDDLVAAHATLAEVVALLNEPAEPGGPTVMPQALRDLDLCLAIDGGTLTYDRDALLDELRQTLDDDAELVNMALRLDAVALTLDAYLSIFEATTIPVSWFVVQPGDDPYLGFCVAREQVEPLREEMEAHTHDVGEATIALDLLVQSGDSSEDWEEYLQEVLDVYETYEEGLSEVCDG